ncbi:MAG: hypothetical protein K0S61_322 [Anaerocolumna sp.]|nr:hypothetical protein [Anaerocolumna sp.]
MLVFNLNGYCDNKIWRKRYEKECKKVNGIASITYDGT